ncbi:MAG: hypothetical protein P8X63_07620 [Desulfuromonadaceae bacterium]
MIKEDLEEFRQLLQSQIDSLLKEADKTVLEMTDEKTNFPDPTDRASLESDRNFELRIRDRERKLIMKIREALERIDNVNSAFVKVVVKKSVRPGFGLAQ